MIARQNWSCHIYGWMAHGTLIIPVVSHKGWTRSCALKNGWCGYCITVYSPILVYSRGLPGNTVFRFGLGFEQNMWARPFRKWTMPWHTLPFKKVSQQQSRSAHRCMYSTVCVQHGVCTARCVYSTVPVQNSACTARCVYKIVHVQHGVCTTQIEKCNS